MSARTLISRSGMAGLIIIVLLASSVLAGSNGTFVGTNSALDVELVNYQPVPAQPGDSLDVWLQVTNDGGAPSEAGRVHLVDSFPFIIESASERDKEFQSVPAQGNFLIRTRVRVDKNAHEGTNYLSVQLQDSTGRSFLEKEVPITIQGRSGTLSITKVEQERIAPGEKRPITIVLQNVGDTKLRNVQMSLDLTGLSLAPIDGSNSKTIASMDGGKSASFTFTLAAFPDASENTYQVPVTLAYEDEQGNSKSQSETIGITIGSEPELVVYPESSALTQERPEGQVTLKFVNRGLGEIKLLEMTVEENDGVQVTSESPTLYVGNIDVDDYESATLTLKARQLPVDVPIKVEYRDALNQPHEETVNVRLKPSGDGQQGGVSVWLWILILLLLVGLLFWWRKRKKK